MKISESVDIMFYLTHTLEKMLFKKQIRFFQESLNIKIAKNKTDQQKSNQFTLPI